MVILIAKLYDILTDSLKHEWLNKGTTIFFFFFFSYEKKHYEYQAKTAVEISVVELTFINPCKCLVQ